MTTHRLITPWPIGGASGLHTWCGRSAKEVASDRFATDPSAVTCARCTEAMRAALEQLSVDVPRLPPQTAPALHVRVRWTDTSGVVALTSGEETTIAGLVAERERGRCRLSQLEHDNFMLREALTDAVKQLGGHPDSCLTGEDGLAAATMRDRARLERELDAATVERDRLQHEVQMLRDQMRRRGAGEMVLASDVAEMLGDALDEGQS